MAGIPSGMGEVPERGWVLWPRFIGMRGVRKPFFTNYDARRDRPPKEGP
jgi:hypothetical protein